MITVLVAALPVAVVVRWIRTGWQPVSAPDEPLDFARLTIAGIPLEELGLGPAQEYLT